MRQGRAGERTNPTATDSKISVSETGENESAIVDLLADDTNAVEGRTRIGSSVRGTRVQTTNARSPVATMSNGTLVINSQDNGAVRFKRG